MRQGHQWMVPDRRLLLFKWLMILIPPGTFLVSHVIGLMGGHYRPGDTMSSLAESLLLTLLVALVALVLAYLYAQTMVSVLRRLQAEALAREREILTMNAVMQERERLSRELHDGVAQLVAHLLLRLDTIKDLIQDGRRQEAGAELERLHGVANEIYQDIGESITGLRANMAERGLSGTLKDYADQFEERYQIPVRLRADEAADRLSPFSALQLFRMIQEALTNIRKHSGAREATVSLRAEGPDHLKVVIADDGQGFSPGSRNGGTGRPLGLTSMRERAVALGGTFQVVSEPGSGTQVIAAVPIAGTRRETGHEAAATPDR
jgi:two-component system, NarL family, sensor histidine kinase DegS